MKIVIAIAFVGILGALACALVFLMRDKGGSNRTVNALTVRVSLSVDGLDRAAIVLSVASAARYVETRRSVSCPPPLHLIRYCSGSRQARVAAVVGILLQQRATVWAHRPRSG